MTKPKSKPKAAARLPARKSSKPKSREQSVLAASKSPTRPKTKHARIIAMLRTSGRNNRCDHGRHGLAAAFGARLSRRCRPQETRSQPCFRANRQGASISHQGQQSFVRRLGPGQTAGLIRCRGNIATVAPRPKCLLSTRSRICAVSISKDFVHAGRAYFKGRSLLI